MKKPIFILGAHKSGTSLLRSLLDGHPDLFVLPLETHPFQMSHHWVDYRLRSERPPLLSINETKKQFLRWVEHYNSISDPYADANLINRFDITSFRDALGPETHTYKELFEQYFEAIYRSLFGKTMPANLRVVEKSVEHAEFAFDLCSMFPDAKFIHIVRNPYSNLVSLRKYLNRGKKRYYPFIGRAIKSLYNSYYALQKNQRFINDYLALKYEDLLRDTQLTMRLIAEFAEIDYNDILLTPTLLGDPWLGNSIRNIRFTKVSSHNLDVWLSEINHLEIQHINYYFKFLLDEYGYKELETKQSIIWPVAWETPKSYILNRLIRYFL